MGFRVESFGAADGNPAFISMGSMVHYTIHCTFKRITGGIMLVILSASKLA